MTLKAKIAIFIALVLWASAFVGIRAGLEEYSPEGLALLRYLVASVCLSAVYIIRPRRNPVRFRDFYLLLAVGVIGIGIYNLTLNYGELTISSGMSSFIISQAPILTAVLAIIFLGETLSFTRVLGFVISILGVALITIGEQESFSLSLIHI